MARAPSKNPSYAPTVGTYGTMPAGTANVDYIRPELAKILPKYTLIDDAIAGSEAVKAKRKAYLPMPNAADLSPENAARYDAYVLRAVYYGISERTLAGMVGEVFNVPPEISVPELLNPVVKDAAGDGVPLAQQAQAAEEHVLKKGRAGLLVDYPRTDGVVTRKQQQEGEIRPTIVLYEPQDIINWRKEKVGSSTLFTLIVLREDYEVTDDGFSVEVKTQYRVLRLVNGLYIQEVWRGESGAYQPVPELTAMPTDASGNRLTSIPFKFIGAVDNTETIDAPPMYAICDLNIAHYRNSADYEESVFIAGQATPVLTGLDQRWVKEVLDGRVELGSRAAIMLPTGADAKLLQMEANSAPFEAMEHKERLMVGLGAKLVEMKRVQRTATEATQEEAAETSVLKTITDNVSEAYRWALEWCAIFQGVTTEAADASASMTSENAIVFKLNTEFNLAMVGPEQVKTTIESWQKEAISYTEMRAQLKKAALAFQDDETARTEIAEAALDIGATNIVRNGDE